MNERRITRMLDARWRWRAKCFARTVAWSAAAVIVMLAAFATSPSQADDVRTLSWVESHPATGAANIITRSQLAITDDGRWVVVCREREQSVFLFKREFDSGRLTRCGQFDVGGWKINPRCVAIAPASKQVFVGGADGSLFMLEINEHDNTLRGPGPMEWQRYLRSRRVALTEINGLVVFAGGRRVCAIDTSSSSIGLLEFEGTFCHQRTVRVLQDRKFGQQGEGRPFAFASPVDGTLVATGLAVTPDGGKAVVTSGTQNSVTAFRVNAQSMSLERIAGVAYDQTKNEGCRALTSPRAVAISPDGKHVYVVGGISNLAWLKLDNLTVAGSIETETAPMAAKMLSRPVCVAVAPDGKRVFVVNQREPSIAVFRRNPETGDLTYESSARNHEQGTTRIQRMSWCTPSPDGRHLYATSAESIAVTFAIANE